MIVKAAVHLCKGNNELESPYCENVFPLQNIDELNGFFYSLKFRMLGCTVVMHYSVRKCNAQDVECVD